MDKIEFNQLSIMNQLEYINNMLAKGESLRSISASLHMSKTTIRDRFKKLGYTFNNATKQYIKDNSSIKAVEYKHDTNVSQHTKIKENKSVVRNKYKNNTDILNDKEIKEIREMLKWYSNQKNVINKSDLKELKINTDLFTGEVKTTTIRLYSDVWKNFRNFTEEFKEYKSMDLISMALLEFIEKYSK